MYVLPDNDSAGEAYACEAVLRLSDARAKVKILQLPGLPDKGDLADWVQAGGTAGRLAELFATAKGWGDYHAEKRKKKRPDGEDNPNLQLIRELLDQSGCHSEDDGGGFLCLCPSHELDGGQHTPSLKVSPGGKVPVVMHCRSGCDYHTAVIPAIEQLLADMGYHYSIGKLASVPLSELEAREERAKLRKSADNNYAGKRDSPGRRESKQGFPHATPSRSRARPTYVTAADLLKMEIPPMKWAIPGMLPAGLTVLAGRGKRGKSWLTLDMALSVAAGRPVLSSESLAAGDTICLALEDTALRLQDRVGKLMPGQSPPDRCILFSTKSGWPEKDTEAGIAELRRLLQERPETRLVIVDVLARFRTPSKGKSSYEEDYAAMVALKGVADEFGVAVVVVTHLNKTLNLPDPFDAITGTTGIAAAADTLMLFDRKKGANTARLMLRGRDVEEITLNLALDESRWVLISAEDDEADEKEESPPKVREAKQFLAEQLKDGPKLKNEILQAAQSQGISQATLYRAKKELQAQGVDEAGGCKWRLSA